MGAALPEVFRTPDARFANLPGFPWQPRFVEDLRGFEGLALAYLDEREAATPRGTVLCLHGQPTWGYLYRRMIPVFLAAGYRVIVPDLFGFGRSDKPTDEGFYTFSRHRAALLAFIDRLRIENALFVVQDWGGLLGLTLPMERPAACNRLLVMNTALGTGDAPLPQGFLDWRAFSNSRPDMDVTNLLQRAVPHLTPAEAAAYGAPFPDRASKAGVRRFPNLVPDRLDADGAETSRAAREWWRTEWNGRLYMAIGMKDPVLGPPVMHALHQIFRGGGPIQEVPEGGHFLQEWGAAIAQSALASLDA